MVHVHQFIAIDESETLAPERLAAQAIEHVPPTVDRGHLEVVHPERSKRSKGTRTTAGTPRAAGWWRVRWIAAGYGRVQPDGPLVDEEPADLDGRAGRPVQKDGERRAAGRRGDAVTQTSVVVPCTVATTNDAVPTPPFGLTATLFVAASTDATPLRVNDVLPIT